MNDESHFRLRIPASLKARVEAAAKADGRSINAQVLAFIEAALGQGGEIEELQQQIDDHEGRIKELERDVYRALDHAGLLRDYR